MDTTVLLELKTGQNTRIFQPPQVWQMSNWKKLWRRKLKSTTEWETAQLITLKGFRQSHKLSKSTVLVFTTFQLLIDKVLIISLLCNLHLHNLSSPLTTSQLKLYINLLLYESNEGSFSSWRLIPFNKAVSLKRCYQIPPNFLLTYDVYHVRRTYRKWTRKYIFSALRFTKP